MRVKYLIALVVPMNFLISVVIGQAPKDTLSIFDDGTYAPYCFIYNENSEERKVAGIFVDIWKLWSEKTGVPIKFQLTNTFQEAILRVEQGEKGIICGICPKYRKFKLLYSVPHYTVIAKPIILKEQKIFYKTLHDGNFVFGTCNGDVINDIISKEFRNLIPKQIDSYSGLIDSLLDGNVSGILIEEPVLRFRLFETGQLHRLKDFAIMSDEVLEPICAGASDPKVLALINEGFSKITSLELRAIEDKWVKKYEPSIFYDLFLQSTKLISEHPILSPVAIFALILLLLNICLIFIFFTRPWRLLNIQYAFDSLPEIKIPIKGLSFSAKNLIIVSLLIRSKKFYLSYYDNFKPDLLKITFANLDIDYSKFDYLPFPLRINGYTPNILPLGDNSLEIKECLQNTFAKENVLRVLISGNGGIGKTTLCARVIKWVIDDRDFYPSPLVFLPIDFKSIDETLSLEEFKKVSYASIFNLFNSFFEKKINEKFFNFCLNKSMICLIVDSLSEYTNAKRLKISGFLSSLEKDKVGIVITSRYVDYRIGEFKVHIEPDFLKSAFLLNLIQQVYINKNDIKDFTKDDSKKVNDLFILLNKITNDNGVTPLFCSLFSRELSSFILPNNQEILGINNLYEQVFTKYLERVIGKIQDVNSDDLEDDIERIKNFAAFFAWKQISIDDSYSLNNYLTLNDLKEYENAVEHLKHLNSAGSFLIEKEDMYKIKFDPIAEFLANLYLYKETRDDLNNEALNMLLIEPYSSERLSVLKSFFEYLKDKSLEDKRTEDLIILVEDSINTIAKTLKSYN